MTSDPLPAGEIHLHMTDDPAITSPSLLAAYETLLMPDERAQRDRFRFDRHRHKFLVSRALLRTTLTLYQPSVAPQDWRFELNAHGRPHIAGDAGGDLDFNLSHTEGRMVLAVCRISLPGVDIEALCRTDEMIELARQFFAPDEVADLVIQAPALQRRRFFDLWTLKEAYVKARGLGLAIPLNAFTIGFPAASGLSIDCGRQAEDSAEPWQLWSIDVGDCYALSLAIQHRKPLFVRQFDNCPLRAITEMECVILRRVGASQGSP